MRRSWSLALLAALIAAGSLGASARPRTLRVFAAVSLGEAFGDIVREFESLHPGLRVQLNLAGTQQLATQVEQGAQADVFAAADARWMKYLGDHSFLAGPPVLFARNRLVVIVPAANPARITRLQDLARRGVKLVIGADVVPIGRYSREVLRKLAVAPGFDSAFAAGAMANVVSEEENVKSVVGKVQLGEADAGICYRSDVTARLALAVRVFEIPEPANVVADYPIAVLARSERAKEAREFVAFVLSGRGQGPLARHGLIPIGTVP